MARLQPAAATTGSGSGLSGADLGTQSTDRDITAAVTAYRAYVVCQIGSLRTATTRFTDAVRAGDLASAKQRYAPSRLGQERMPIAGLAPELDGAPDLRVDDFASPEDPMWTGWHRLEYPL